MQKFLKSFSLIIFLISPLPILGKNKTKFKMLHKDNVNFSTSRNLEEDNYIVLNFNRKCNYSSGFSNYFRYDINFIINKKNISIKYKKESPFNVTKDYGIEIHFNKAISSLNSYFDSDYDKNMKFLVFADLSNFDPSNIENLGYMFDGCSSLISINLSNFNTSKVIDMGYMFYGCSSLVSIDLSNFDTSKVTDMWGMFYGCSSLISINLSNFDTSNITYMWGMFEGCSSLISINVSNFNTSNVKYMWGLFNGCSSLISIDLSNFDTSKVTYMGYMFHGCSSLISIDLSNFNMSNCISYNDMFSNNNNIKYINIYNFKNDKIISKTFNNINNSIFICQKDKIIVNPKAYNCCDFNLKAYDCISSNY